VKAFVTTLVGNSDLFIISPRFIEQCYTDVMKRCEMRTKFYLQLHCYFLTMQIDAIFIDGKSF